MVVAALEALLSAAESGSSQFLARLMELSNFLKRPVSWKEETGQESKEKVRKRQPNVALGEVTLLALEEVAAALVVVVATHKDTSVTPAVRISWRFGERKGKQTHVFVRQLSKHPKCIRSFCV
jgi:hypothetical protein